MTPSYQASSRMAPESSYTSYNPPPYSIIQKSASSILRKPSSSSSPPKSVSFAAEPQSPQPIRFRQSDIQHLKDCLLHWQQTMNQTVDQSINSTINTFDENKARQAEEARLAKARAEEQQARQARIAETARLAKEYRLLAEQQVNEARLAEQARIEEARRAKERAELLLQQKTKEARIAKEQSEAFACRRCSAKFPSNTKLHHHIEDHHAKKPAKPAEPTPPSTPKAEPAKITIAELTPPATPLSTSEPALLLTPPASHPEPISNISLPDTPPATPIATPRKQISWAEIASRPVIAPKPSRLPISTSKSVPKCTETASLIAPPTPPPTPPQGSVPKHQHQKPYLTIDDLFEMFAEKSKATGPLHTKKRASSPSVSFLHQTQITSYFKSAANQSIRISQGSKTPNSRSFQQHMPAAVRTEYLPPRKTTSEKSVISPYKLAVISRFKPKAEIVKTSVKSPTIRAFPNISGSCHNCRICSGTFGSNNGLHRHLRATHFNQGPRHCQEKPREPRALRRNAMFRRSLTS